MVSQQHASIVLTSPEPAILVHSRAAIVLQGKPLHQCKRRTDITMQCLLAFLPVILLQNGSGVTNAQQLQAQQMCALHTAPAPPHQHT